MSPTKKSENFTVRETGQIDGGAYRVVSFSDGSARVEGWGPKGWTPGGASFGEIANAPPVSARFAAELGIPLSDLALATAPPRRRSSSKLSEEDLRQAIRLGVRMAEEEALFKLTMKARQTRAAELDRRRPRLVVDNTA